jgi:hypothetical protein
MHLKEVRKRNNPNHLRGTVLNCKVGEDYDVMLTKEEAICG